MYEDFIVQKNIIVSFTFDRLNFVREEGLRIKIMECDWNKTYYTLKSNFISFIVNIEIESRYLHLFTQPKKKFKKKTPLKK